MDSNNELVEKMSKFAFTMGIVGICLVGIVPAFGMMAIAVPIVFKHKKVGMNEKQAKWCKSAMIMGAISLVLFVIDFIIALMCF